MGQYFSEAYFCLFKCHECNSLLPQKKKKCVSVQSLNGTIWSLVCFKHIEILTLFNSLRFKNLQEAPLPGIGNSGRGLV